MPGAQLVGGTAHDQAGKVEHGEHGARATGVALVLELERAGEGLLAVQPQHEEAEQRDEQKRGEPLGRAREIEREAGEIGSGSHFRSSVRKVNVSPIFSATRSSLGGTKVRLNRRKMTSPICVLIVTGCG
jgi:hypothetical protein